MRSDTAQHGGRRSPAGGHEGCMIRKDVDKSQLYRFIEHKHGNRQWLTTR
jgi:hypothetical protein